MTDEGWELSLVLQLIGEEGDGVQEEQDDVSRVKVGALLGKKTGLIFMQSPRMELVVHLLPLVTRVLFLWR
jgi:hypothetical protein